MRRDGFSRVHPPSTITQSTRSSVGVDGRSGAASAAGAPVSSLATADETSDTCCDRREKKLPGPA